ncbi:MAG: AAA family ATPase [Clostridia bacterium]|nr:AAA family ATPase [Clostridia bacterium]
MWEKICIIDTENESGSLYVGKQVGSTRVGEYLTINLEAPFSAARYLEAIDLAEQAGVEYLVIDSLSHAWTGEGGLLDVQGNVAKRSGNSYTAWREVTPMHNRLVDRILQCAMHVALTLRTKTEYVIEDNGNGKKTPRKIGMAPVFRDGIEYEVTIFFELDQSHAAAATKDRTGIFDGQYFMIAPNTGKQIYQWLAGGAAEPSTPLPIKATQSEPEDDTPLPVKVEQVMQRYCANMTREEKEVVAARIKSITGGTANYRAVTDEAILQRIYDTFKGAPNASGMEG